MKAIWRSCFEEKMKKAQEDAGSLKPLPTCRVKALLGGGEFHSSGLAASDGNLRFRTSRDDSLAVEVHRTGTTGAGDCEYYCEQFFPWNKIAVITLQEKRASNKRLRPAVFGG